MKKLLAVAALVGGIMTTACSHNSSTDDNGTPAPLPQTNTAGNPAPPPGTPATGTTPDQTANATESTATNTATSTPPPTKPAVSFPMGIVIPGKKGYCKSPYAEYAEPVDIRGFPPGTQVRCPYTNKIFIVPQT